MREIGQGLALLAFLSGLRAAWLWYKASAVDIRPMMEVGGELLEIDVDLHPNEWIRAMAGTLKKSGEINRRAAFWTAVSVAASGLLSAISLLS